MREVHLAVILSLFQGLIMQEETIVRDLTLITAASRVQTAQYVQELFSNHYFKLYTNTDVIESGSTILKILCCRCWSLVVWDPVTMPRHHRSSSGYQE